MLDWSKFSGKFHESWHQKMQPFIESNECETIFKFLKQESGEGRVISPSSDNLFRAFKWPLDNIKVVIVGYCPYHTQKGSQLVANGVCMSTDIYNFIPPSLEQFYNGLEKELYDGMSLKYEQVGDLGYLMDQGVFLINAALTTQLNVAGKHQEIWQPFIKHLFEVCLAPTNVPVVFLGNEAYKCRQYLLPMQHFFKCSHSAASTYNNEEWSTESLHNGKTKCTKTFTQINNILNDMNGTTISWLKLYEEPSWETPPWD